MSLDYESKKLIGAVKVLIRRFDNSERIKRSINHLDWRLTLDYEYEDNYIFLKNSVVFYITDLFLDNKISRDEYRSYIEKAEMFLG